MNTDIALAAGFHPAATLSQPTTSIACNIHLINPNPGEDEHAIS